MKHAHALNYSVVDNEDGTFSSFENKTAQSLTKHITRESASATTKSLNLGGGFDGRTPEYFLHTGPVRLN